MRGPDPPASSRRVVLVFALLSLGLQGCATLGHADRPRPVVRGPIPSRNLQPIATTLLAFRPRRAAIQPAGEWQTRVSAGYASVEEIPASDGDRVSIDAELGRLELGARVGIGGLADLELALPFLYTTSGFLDGMIEWFHESLALPDGGRDELPDDQFDVELVSDGQQLYQLDEDRFGIQDIPILLGLRLREEDEAGPGLIARVGIELPTGDEDAGFGNGAVDWGLGLSLERSWGRWTLFSGADYVFVGQSERFEESGRHRLEDFLDLQLGVEYRWSNRVSLLAQTTWTERQIDTLPFEEVAREVFDLGLGVGVDTSARSSLTASIHEDLVAATGADITLLVSWRADW